MLPDAKTIFGVLTQSTQPSTHASDATGSVVLEALSALAEVHRSMALQHAGIAAASGAEDSEQTIALWEEEHHRIRDIDAAVAHTLGTPHATGQTGDGLGSLLSRVCFWHTRAFRGGLVLDGPHGAARQELGRALAAYERRAAELATSA